MSGTDSKPDAAKAPPATSAPARPESPRDHSAEPPIRTPREVSWTRWASRAVNGAILALVAVVCAYLLTPGRYIQRIPYGEESIGQFAKAVEKATRDYDIPDEETTLRKREEVPA